MKLGVSSYCFRQLLSSGEMDLIGVLDWVAASRAGHIEIAATDGAYYLENDRVVRDTAKHAEEVGVPIVNYLVSGDLREGDGKEVDVLRRQLDVAQRFGAGIFRHDVAPWAWRERDPGSSSRPSRRSSKAAARSPTMRRSSAWCRPSRTTASS